MALTIALVGNPNSGKTTLFNSLTGANQYVGNWPGVTIEKKEGKLKGNKEISIMDLPGIYSLSPYSLEEVITRDYIINERPDVIIDIVDGSNLERNLYLTTQLAEIGIPIVIGLNMMDIVKKNNDKVDLLKLSQELGCRIVPLSAVKNEGTDVVVKAAIDAAQSKEVPHPPVYSSEIENALKDIEQAVSGKLTDLPKRFELVKLFDRDEKVLENLKLSAEEKGAVESAITSCEKELDDEAQSIIANARYEYIENALKETFKKSVANRETTSDKIDKIVTNRFLALPIFAGIMFLIYYISITTVGDWTIGWIEGAFETLTESAGAWLEGVGAAEWLIGLVCDGIIAGVGGVLTFVPQIMILFLFIALLEDCGYMSRVAFILDRLFRKFGLSGKSVIPMIIGTGCSVPAIMASRTIENDKDRKLTIMLTPFIPCSAKLPVFALLIGAFFPDNPWVGPSMYLLGIAMVILCGLILKKTPLFKGDPSPFVMELPQYKIPAARNVFRSVLERGGSFIVRAGTIIFLASGLIWFLQSFDWSLQMVDAEESILASIGNFIAPIFSPLGFGNWIASVATVTGLLAKETIVATFGILLGMGEVAEDDPGLVARMGQFFTPVSAYAFMTFTLLAAPCFAAIGATKREMGSWKWTLITVAFQTGFAYFAALLVNQIGSLIF